MNEIKNGIFHSVPYVLDHSKQIYGKFHYYFQPSVKYANFPSCSGSDWGTRYWDHYSRLEKVKKYWDPANTFHHCHSVGSSNNTCCPDYESNQYSNKNKNKNKNNNNNKQILSSDCMKFLFNLNAN